MFTHSLLQRLTPSQALLSGLDSQEMLALDASVDGRAKDER
jgi:hypothetical protein